MHNFSADILDPDDFIEVFHGPSPRVPPDAPARPWRVATTPDAIRARAALRDFGVEALVPTQTITIAQGRTRLKKQVCRALLPGYVFARISTPTALEALRRVRLNSGIAAVTRWLGPQGNPMSIPDREMDTLLDFLERRAAGDLPRYTGPELALGGGAKVLAGPFEDKAGLIEHLTRETCRVLVDIFGRPTPVIVPRADLAPTCAGCGAALTRDGAHSKCEDCA